MMMKRLTLHLAGAAVLLAAAASPAGAQGAGKDLAMDFRTSTAVAGSPDSGVVTGHIVSSPTTVRIDMSTVGGRAPTPLPTDGSVSMIVSDSGRTITYLDTKNHQYMRFRPTEMFAQPEMSAVKMDFSGTEATVTNLGAGPPVLGHPTARYRMVTGMTMTITGMGEQQSVRISSTTDYLYPTDIKTAFNPFASITGTDILGMFGGGSKELTAKLKAAESKLPKAPPLRIETSATVSAQGMTTITRSSTEVTSVRWVNADPKVFEVPAGYSAVELSAIGGAPPKP